MSSTPVPSFTYLVATDLSHKSKESFMRSLIALCGLTLVVGAVQAADSISSPRPTPLTRPEMKQYLEDMKQRTPRVPLPEMTAEEKQRYGEDASRGYESRLRSLYLPGGNERFSFSGGSSGSRTGGTRPDGAKSDASRPAGTSRGFGRENEPGMTLDYRFKVSLFWIVSRTNNCQYCLGHQESKLLSAGMTEDEIAALDVDWKQFTPAEQAAFAF